MRLLAVFSSVKSAAVLIALVAAVTCLATVYERDYGRDAVAVMVYQAWWFKVLFAFLAVNIFGAAAVRYPWRRNQYGFVVVHAGLLTLMTGFALAGGRLDGLLAVSTQEASSRIVLPNDYLAVVDGDRRLQFHFQPLEFAGYPSFARFCLRPIWPYTRPLNFRCDPPVTLSPVRTDADAPIVRVKRVVDTAQRSPGFVADASGMAALKVALSGRFPGMPSTALMPVGQKWLSPAGDCLYEAGPATVCLANTYQKRLVDDFLAEKPEVSGEGKLIVYWKDVRKEIALSQASFPLSVDVAPDCRIEVEKILTRPGFDESGPRQDEKMAFDPLVVVHYEVGADTDRKEHSQPVFAYYPCTVGPHSPQEEIPEFLYLHPGMYQPTPGDQGVSFETLIGPDGRLHARWFSRSKGLLGSARDITTWNETIVGGPDTPMQLAAELIYLPNAVPGPEPIAMQPENKDRAERWMEIEVSKGGASGSVWMSRRSEKPLKLSDGSEVLLRYDHDQHDLMAANGFAVKLVRFEEGKDPGGGRSASYSSHVIVSDKDGSTWPGLVTMNEPLTVNGVTLYQNSFEPEFDEQGAATGGYISYLIAANDPGRRCKYLGSVLLVAGILLLYRLRSKPGKAA